MPHRAGARHHRAEPIGIDDAMAKRDCHGTMSRALDPKAAAVEYAGLFPSVYLRFHRRTGKRRELSGVSRGVLLHLAQSGPLTVGECARHIQRAQSVVSEIVDQLERHGLLARVRDERDRRRTLVWLTDRGKSRILEDQEVLSLATLSEAFALMTPASRRALLLGTTALIRAAERVAERPRKTQVKP
jgi:DNA-binding MarR family transcriptional regulator